MGAGRPEFEPTDQQRLDVEKYASLGITQEEIGSILGIHRHTVSKHFQDEFKRGKAKANAKVAQRLFNKTIDDTTAMIFWLKTQARWSERVEHVIEMPQTVFQIMNKGNDRDSGN